MSQPAPIKSNRSGGSAAAGGMNYQAAVTTIAFVHMLRGLPLGWADSGFDVPTSVSAEAGAVGDDIRIETASGHVLQIQVKKNINAGDSLWAELLELATATHANSQLWAIVVVGPQSSGVVRDDLARAIRRIGDGRVDDLTQVGKKFLGMLQARGLPPSACGRLRIKTINALTDDSAHVDLAISELEKLGVPRQQGWNRLYVDAGRLIEYRGRRTATTLAELLPVREQGTQVSPFATAQKLTAAALSESSTLSILGIPQPLAMEEAWLQQKVAPWSRSEIAVGGLAEALNHYHAHGDKKDGEKFDADGLGWFKKQCVVVGGPGMGKSTLLRRLRATYARKSNVALLVSLRMISQRMRSSGSTFEECLLTLGLESTGTRPDEVRALGLANLTWLLDGIDECGDYIEPLAESIKRFSVANAGVRIIVTTRPIGYETSLLADWKHYRLLPPESSAASNVTALIRSVTSMSEAERDAAISFAREQLGSDALKAVAASSPMLAGLIASLSFSRIAAGPTEASFYEAVFGLVHRVRTPRKPSTNLTRAILDAVLYRLAWLVLERPDTDCLSAIEMCTDHLRLALGGSSLNARATCEETLLFWEAVGVIERVHHQGLEAYTFVHKTFAEFSAAKALTNSVQSNGTEPLMEVLAKPELRKVLEFAWDLGISQQLLEVVLADSGVGVEALELAMKLIRRGEVPLSDNVRLKLLDAAWTAIGNSSERSAYKLGHALVKVSEQFPLAVPASLERLDHLPIPIRLIAWTIVAVRCPGCLEFERFDAFFQDYVAYQRTQPRLHEGFEIRDPLGGLLRRLLVGVLGELASRGIDQQAEDFAARVQAGVPGFVFLSMDDVFVEAGWPGFNKEAPRDFMAGFLSPESTAQRRREKIELLKLIGMAAPWGEGVRPVSMPWMQLSGFLSATLHGKIDHDALFELEQWKKPLSHVFQAIIAIAALDKEQLGTEVGQLLESLRPVDADPFTFYDGLYDVDIDLDWSLADHLSLDAKLLEEAIAHPSLWVGYLAGNLLQRIVKGNQLSDVVGRLLDLGGFSTSRIATALAADLDPDEARNLIEDRLARGLQDGCRHLFDALAERPPISSWSETTASFLNHGLRFGPYTAVAASKAAAAYAPYAVPRVEQLLTEAYQYWQANAPVASSPHSEPRSPRVDILRALMICGPQPKIVMEALTDIRSDVRQLATDAAMEMMRDDGSFRAGFVQGVVTGTFDSSLLRAALSKRIPFDASEVVHLTKCLRSSDPKMRFAATGLLESTYLSFQQIAAFREELAEDPVAAIRDHIHNLPQAGP